MKPELLQAIQTVRDNMKSVARNASGYNYKYTDLPHLWDSIDETITKAGFTIVNTCDGENIVTAAVHEAGEISSKIPLSFAKGNSPQELGSAVTYFRRYNLLMLFNVMTEDDDGAKSQKSAEKVTNKEDFGL